MLQNFGTALSREQMKLVKGGGPVDVELAGDGFSCEDKCNPSTSVCDTGRTCKSIACGQTQCQYVCTY